MNLDLSPAHLKALHLFDWSLAEGPDYEKLALLGAALGAGAAFLLDEGDYIEPVVPKMAKYGFAGAVVAVLGVGAIFGVGHYVSERSHEALAEAAARAPFPAPPQGT